VKPRALIGLGLLACIPCCVGPILAVLGAVAALGVASTVLIGGAGLVITGAAIAAAVLVHRRARRDTIEPVAVELAPSRSSIR
jgi:hypothetical protein